MLVSGLFDILSSLLSLLLIILIFPYCDILPVSIAIAISLIVLVLSSILLLVVRWILSVHLLIVPFLISHIEYSWVTFFDRGSYSATIFLPLLVRFCVVRTSVCPHLFYDRNDWTGIIIFYHGRSYYSSTSILQCTNSNHPSYHIIICLTTIWLDFQLLGQQYYDENNNECSIFLCFYKVKASCERLKEAYKHHYYHELI